MVKKENTNLPIYYWKKTIRDNFTPMVKHNWLKKVPQFDSVLKWIKKLVLITLKKEQEEIPKEYLDQMVLTESNYKTVFVTNNRRK
jgi:hypothetical protein